MFADADDLTVVRAYAESQDERAFRELMKRFDMPIRAYLSRKFFTHEIVEQGFAGVDDIMQEFWLRVHRHIGVYDPKGAKFSSWLFVIASNLGKNYLRDRKRRRTDRFQQVRRVNDEDAPPEEQYPDTRPTPDVEFDIQNDMEVMAVVVQEVLHQLPLRQRRALELRGMLPENPVHSYEEIARALQLPEGTVKSTLSRAKRSARKVYLSHRPDKSP